MERLKLKYYYGQEAEQFTFYRLPKALITDSRFKDISNNAKLLYGLMLDRMSLSVRSGWFDDENRVYIKYAVKSIMEDLNCSKMTAVGLLKELLSIGLIDMEQKSGCANVIYVKNFISENKCNTVDRSNNCTSQKNVQGKIEESEEENSLEIRPVQKLDQSENQTSIGIIPVHKSDQSEEETSIEISPVQNLDRSENQTGTGRKNRPGVVQNIDPINNDFSDNNFSENNSIIQFGERQEIIQSNRYGEVDETTAYMKIIRNNIEYDVMMSDKEWNDRDLYDELYELICDVVCVNRKTVRIAGEDYPYSLVKSKFLKLNTSHLEYVINCMQNNSTKIANIKSYLITALYNAPNTINHYYSAEVNHKMQIM